MANGLPKKRVIARIIYIPIIFGVGVATLFFFCGVFESPYFLEKLASATSTLLSACFTLTGLLITSMSIFAALPESDMIKQMRTKKLYGNFLVSAAVGLVLLIVSSLVGVAAIFYLNKLIAILFIILLVSAFFAFSAIAYKLALLLYNINKQALLPKE